MNIHLDDLKVGTYREVTPKEMKTLLELIKDSSSETVRNIHES
jgi:16S rRNA U516 pseudouridylate synthase RsuA-like enzyme